MGIPDCQLSFSGRPLGWPVFRFLPREPAATKWRGYHLQADRENRSAAGSLAGDVGVLPAHLRFRTLVPVLEVVCAHSLEQSYVARIVAAGRVQPCGRRLFLFLANGRATRVDIFQNSEAAAFSRMSESRHHRLAASSGLDWTADQRRRRHLYRSSVGSGTIPAILEYQSGGSALSVLCALDGMRDDHASAGLETRIN